MLVFLKGLPKKSDQFGANGIVACKTGATGFGVSFSSRAIFWLKMLSNWRSQNESMGVFI